MEEQANMDAGQKSVNQGTRNARGAWSVGAFTGIVALFVGIAIGYYVGSQTTPSAVKGVAETDREQQQEQIVGETGQKSELEVSPAGWGTYEIDSKGISFRYPKEQFTVERKDENNLSVKFKNRKEQGKAYKLFDLRIEEDPSIEQNTARDVWFDEEYDSYIFSVGGSKNRRPLVDVNLSSEQPVAACARALFGNAEISAVGFERTILPAGDIPPIPPEQPGDSYYILLTGNTEMWITTYETLTSHAGPTAPDEAVRSRWLSDIFSTLTFDNQNYQPIDDVMCGIDGRPQG